MACNEAQTLELTVVRVDETFFISCIACPITTHNVRELRLYRRSFTLNRLETSPGILTPGGENQIRLEAVISLSCQYQTVKSLNFEN